MFFFTLLFSLLSLQGSNNEVIAEDLAQYIIRFSPLFEDLKKFQLTENVLSGSSDNNRLVLPVKKEEIQNLDECCSDNDDVNLDKLTKAWNIANKLSLTARDSSTKSIYNKFMLFVDRQDDYHSLVEFLKKANQIIGDDFQNQATDYIHLTITKKFPNKIFSKFCNACMPINLDFLGEGIFADEVQSIQKLTHNFSLITLKALQERKKGVDLRMRWNNKIAIYNESTGDIIKSKAYEISVNKKYMWFKEEVTKSTYIIDLENSTFLDSNFIKWTKKGVIEEIFSPEFFITGSHKLKISIYYNQGFIKKFSLCHTDVILDYIVNRCSCKNKTFFPCHRFIEGKYLIRRTSCKNKTFKYMFVRIDQEHNGMIVLDQFSENQNY